MPGIIMSHLSLKEKIGKLFTIGFTGTTLPRGVQSFIESNHIGFVILFSRNIETIGQVVELTGHIHSLGSTPPTIFTDQEGGTVVRFGEMAATVVSAMGIAATGSPENAETWIHADVHLPSMNRPPANR